MNKKSLAAMSAGFILLVAACSAVNSVANTPLYTVRMEQQSSKMGFLPTAVNVFAYTAEKGCILDYSAGKICGAVPLSTTPYDTYCETCGPETCEGTCETCEETCEETCYPTCADTCPQTCPDTCNTCHASCFTCNPPTCVLTCGSTCKETRCPPCPP
jgi:hypothetical protein